VRLAAVHGINVGPDESVAPAWQSALRSRGMRADVTDIRWPSKGGFMSDAVAFVNPHFKAAADEAVVHGLQDFAHGGPGIVVAHSMGTVLALNAERLLRTGLPILCLASPLSNPGIRPMLEAAGYGQRPRATSIHVWNDDDPIPGGKRAEQPSYFQAVRVAVADNEASEFATEHAVTLYLRHPHTHAALRLLWERMDDA